MNPVFILGKISQILEWDTEVARQEFAWLELMSRLKFDGYEDFRAGVRFIESLADWLQQFASLDERHRAYSFIRHHLVYVSPAEMNHLVELFYPETVEWRILHEAAKRCATAPYLLWADENAIAVFKSLLRKSLFIELSDGARIDIFRRENAGMISNEQVLTAPRINKAKWNDVLKDLREALKEDSAKFAFVYLVDDFLASGTTLLRPGREEGTWDGKMVRFFDDIQDAGVIQTHFEPEWQLCVHHHLATHRGKQTAEQRQAEALKARRDINQDWFDNVQFSYGMVLPEDFPADVERHSEFLTLTDKYYDDSIETKHMKLGGENARLGFGKCALPLVLEHNCPNNSISLIWADTLGKNGQHAMRPLFRRRQRHT